jgi:hypothetical protein
MTDRVVRVLGDHDAFVDRAGLRGLLQEASSRLDAAIVEAAATTAMARERRCGHQPLRLTKDGRNCLDCAHVYARRWRQSGKGRAYKSRANRRARAREELLGKGNA